MCCYTKFIRWLTFSNTSFRKTSNHQYYVLPIVYYFVDMMKSQLTHQFFSGTLLSPSQFIPQAKNTYKSPSFSSAHYILSSTVKIQQPTNRRKSNPAFRFITKKGSALLLFLPFHALYFTHTLHSPFLPLQNRRILFRISAIFQNTWPISLKSPFCIGHLSLALDSPPVPDQ